MTLRDDTWPNLPLAGFDLETTSTDPYSCRMVDMALVFDKYDGSEPLVWQWVVNPGIEIPLETTAIHGISTEYAIEHGVSPEQAVAELAIALKEIPVDTPICVYNAAFDVPILLRESRGAIGSDWPILDGMVLDRYADTYRAGKRTLTATSAAYGLAVTNAHRAAGDCLSAIRMTRAVGQKYSAIGNAKVSSLQTLQRISYRSQMAQMTDYRQKYGETNFSCGLHWPYDPDFPYQ